MLRLLSLPMGEMRHYQIQVISFLCGAVKSGHLSRGKRSHKQKGRVWVVLTDTFLHFFMAPQVRLLRGLPPLTDAYPPFRTRFLTSPSVWTSLWPPKKQDRISA